MHSNCKEDRSHFSLFPPLAQKHEHAKMLAHTHTSTHKHSHTNYIIYHNTLTLPTTYTTLHHTITFTVMPPRPAHVMCSMGRKIKERANFKYENQRWDSDRASGLGADVTCCKKKTVTTTTCKTNPEFHPRGQHSGQGHVHCHTQLDHQHRHHM